MKEKIKDLNKLTLEQLKEELTKIEQQKSKAICKDDIWETGKSYFIRTVTMALTGKLIFVGDKELVLENAAWIADTGRFSDALKSGNFDEVEPFPEGKKLIVGRGSLVDCIEWNHKLPNEQK